MYVPILITDKDYYKSRIEFDKDGTHSPDHIIIGPSVTTFCEYFENALDHFDHFLHEAYI